MSKPAEILLLSERPERVHQWARMLTGPDTSLWQSAAALAPQTRLDVIVTDRDFTSDLLPIRGSAAQLAAGEIGMVRVGHDGPADVRLPDGCTQGELRLACSLLKEVVRLRRQTNRQRRVHRVLTRLAMRDPLTGLPNRRAWEDRLAACDLGPQAGSSALGVAVLDLDQFKSINAQGHLAGDRVLQHVGRQLGEAAGESLFAARLGGDEFGLVLTGLAPRAATELVEHLRIAACAGCDPAVTASAGLALGEGSVAEGAEELLQAADQALCQAKTAGRNRTVAILTADVLIESDWDG